MFTQRGGTDHIPSCHPFSLELPNRPDRTHCPFVLPTGPERSCTLGARGLGGAQALACPGRWLLRGLGPTGHW